MSNYVRSLGGACCAPCAASRGSMGGSSSESKAPLSMLATGAGILALAYILLRGKS